MKYLMPFVVSLLLMANVSAAERQITTSANGEIMAVPDIAFISGQVAVEAKTAKEATRDAQQRLQQVISFVREQGVDNEDLNAADLRVHPKWHYPRNKPRQLVGYQAQARFTVTLRDIDQLSEVYAGLPEAGASTLEQTRYEFSQRDELELKAIAQATQKTRVRANAAVNALDEKLGDVTDLQVNTHWQRPPVVRMQRAMAMEASVETVPELNVGKHKISASVTATFVID